MPAGRDPVVLLPRVYGALAAYVAGRRVYAADTYEQARGTSFHLLPLPPGREVEVTLRVVSRYTQVGLPVGLQLIGAPWAETPLFEIACGYEAITAGAAWRSQEPTQLSLLDDPATPTPGQRAAAMAAYPPS